MIFLAPFLMLFADAPPSAQELIQKALAGSGQQEAKGLKYTFREEQEHYERDKQRQLTRTSRKTYDVIMLEGDNYRKLILVNDEPLEPKLQKKVDQELEKTRAERRKQQRKTFVRTVKDGGLTEVRKLFDVQLIGEENINGRKVWRVAAEPKADVKPANKDEQDALNTRRTIWIDQQEGREVRRLTSFFRVTNSFQPGTEIELNFSKVGDAWLTESLIFRYDLKAMAVVRGRGESRGRFFDYKLLQTDSRLLPE